VFISTLAYSSRGSTQPAGLLASVVHEGRVVGVVTVHSPLGAGVLIAYCVTALTGVLTLIPIVASVTVAGAGASVVGAPAHAGAGAQAAAAGVILWAAGNTQVIHTLGSTAGSHGAGTSTAGGTQGVWLLPIVITTRCIVTDKQDSIAPSVTSHIHGGTSCHTTAHSRAGGPHHLCVVATHFARSTASTAEGVVRLLIVPGGEGRGDTQGRVGAPARGDVHVLTQALTVTHGGEAMLPHTLVSQLLGPGCYVITVLHLNHVSSIGLLSPEGIVLVQSFRALGVRQQAGVSARAAFSYSVEAHCLREGADGHFHPG